MAAGTYDLTTVAKVKTVMRITASTDDTLLQALITAVSDRIERIAGRHLIARDYIDRVQCGSTVKLANYPVLAVDRVAVGETNAISVSASGFARAQLAATASGVRLVSVSAAGVRIVTALEYATYPSMSLMATAISAVTGWTATALVSAPSNTINPSVGVSALSTTAYLTYPDDEWASYRVDDAGILTLLSDSGWPVWLDDPSRTLVIEYRAGYETAPEDLEMLCNEMVQELYQRTKSNTAVTQESLGDYSYTIASGQELSSSQMGTLTRYMEIR